MVDSTPKQERVRAVLSLLGDTPPVPLPFGREVTIHAGHEFLNLGGSVKDRLAKHILLDAEQTIAMAMVMTRRLHGEFGLLVGTFSGTNAVAALQLAAKLGSKAISVTLLSNRAERYFSAPLFDLAGNKHMPGKTIEPPADLVH